MAESKAQSINATLARNDLRVQFDNRWRQELGIGNLEDPQEVAAGLLRQYQVEEEVIKLEEIGLPFAGIRALEVGKTEHASASATEAERAIRDFENDLETLAHDSRLKDIDVELKAWGIAIRRIVADGTRAAGLALDPHQRSRAYAARSALGEYARLARYVGALTRGTNEAFRQLAQSLDVISGLILVLMGEALAAVGTRGGQFLLQAPSSELQERRDAVVLALRNLSGSVHESNDSNTWPRSMEGYRQLIQRLDEAGHSDLRTLLHENALVQQLNELVDLSSAGNSDGLRSLGATAHVTLHRLRRLVHAGHQLVDPESPALATLFSAIGLFVNAFENATSGVRLLFIARPPILFYGHYGVDGPSPAVKRLLRLIIERGRLAELLDCFMDCECSEIRVQCQVILDKILYDLDRAIDLYTIGTDPDGFGLPEQGAAAYGALIQAFLDRYSSDCDFGEGEVIVLLHDVKDQLSGDYFGGTTSDQNNVVQVPEQAVSRMYAELCMQLHAEQAWELLVRRLAPGCRQDYIFPPDGDPIIEVLLDSEDDCLPGALQRVYKLGPDLDLTCPDVGVSIPPHDHTSWDGFINAVNRRGVGRDKPLKGDSALYRKLAPPNLVGTVQRPSPDIDVDINVLQNFIQVMYLMQDTRIDQNRKKVIQELSNLISLVHSRSRKMAEELQKIQYDFDSVPKKELADRQPGFLKAVRRCADEYCQIRIVQPEVQPAPPLDLK